MRKINLLALATLAPLAACSSVVEAVKGPTMAPMGYPSELVGESQVMTLASAREGVPQPASAHSLWRSGARAFFFDQRASKVGDILTVLITINDNANIQNQTAASRTGTNKSGITNFLGLESTLGEGIVSGLRNRQGVRYVQTSAPISPGSSGGGLFDERGNLLGITSFKIEDAENLNFAIAAEDYWTKAAAKKRKSRAKADEDE